jgi:hypothetical protein
MLSLDLQVPKTEERRFYLEQKNGKVQQIATGNPS